VRRCFIIFYLQKELCKYISFFISEEKYYTNQQLVSYQLLVGVKLPNIKKNERNLGSMSLFRSVGQRMKANRRRKKRQSKKIETQVNSTNRIGEKW
jgi:hypothetical protein